MKTHTYILKVSQPISSNARLAHMAKHGTAPKAETLVLEFDNWHAAYHAQRELLQTDLEVSTITERPRHVVYKDAADALDTAYMFFNIEQHG